MSTTLVDRFSPQSIARSFSLLLGASALCVTLLGPGTRASAEVLSISATGLVMRCGPCLGNAEDTATEEKGVFFGQKPNGRYFVPVVFPVTTGQRVCSFSMVYNDINASDTMTARLFRKTYTVGGAPLTGLTTMASVSSASGVPNTVRVATDTTITAPTIINVRAFYYIEVDVETANLNLLGFQIVYKPTCP